MPTTTPSWTPDRLAEARKQIEPFYAALPANESEPLILADLESLADGSATLEEMLENMFGD